MENNVTIDALAQKFFDARGEETYCDLFGAVFALPEWHFIPDGEMPNLSPYCAIFPGFFADQPTVLAFTDKEKLNKYVVSKNLKLSSANKDVVLNSPDATVKFSSENLILSIPTTSVVDYLERLTEKGIKWIVFNQNKESVGFDLGLPQLRETKELMDGKKPKVEAEKNTENAADFDALSRESNESGGAMTDLNNIFGETFALEKWLFIARGSLPNINPYVAANADYAGGQQMIRAFTDSVRLQRFARENNLTDADGSAQMLEIPVKAVVEYLEQFIQYGVHGVWFNSDTVSDGYFIPLAQLRPIKEHLAKIGWKSINQPTDPTLPHNAGFVPPVDSLKPAEQPSAEIKTAVVMMQDGLMSSGDVFTPSSRSYFCFCRIPASWTDGERVKKLVSEKLFEIVYRETWNRKPAPEGSHYIVPQPKSKVYTSEEAGKLDWKTLHQEIVGDVVFLFYIADENGELSEVGETEFQVEIDVSFQKTLQKLSGYIDWFRSGTIKFETSFKPFFQALKPLLADYAGAGEYKFAFAGGIDEPGMKDLFEDVTSNAHGEYLKYRSCISESRGKTEDLQVIGSKRLTHTQTGEKLRVQLTLRKDLAAKTAKLIILLIGLEAEVEKLDAAIQSALDESDFTAQLNSKNTPSPETAEELAR